MFFKFLLIIFLPFSLFLQGCSFEVGEDRKDSPAKVQLQSGRLGCLSGTGRFFNDMLNGQIRSKQRVEATWDCAIHSIDLFVDHVSGDREGIYQSEELLQFLEKYFFDGAKLDRPLFQEAMQLKRGLLGGSDSTLSHEELQRIQELFRILKAQSVKLLPYFPIHFDTISDLSLGEFTAAMNQVRALGEEVGELIGPGARYYNIGSFKDLTERFEEVTERQELLKLARAIRKYFDLAASLKALLVGSPQYQVRPGQWDDLIATGAHVQTLLWQFKYIGSRYESYNRGEGLKQTVGLMNELRNMLVEGMASYKGYSFPFEHFNDFAGNLIELPGFPFVITRKSTREFLEAAIPRLTNPPAEDPTLFDRNETDFNLQALNRVFRQVNYWKAGQNFLNSLSQKRLRRGVLRPDPNYPYGENLRQDAKHDMLQALCCQPTFFREGYPDIFFSEKASGAPATRYNLSQFSWLRAVTRLFIRSYAEDPVRAENYGGVTIKEFQELYRDLAPIGEEIGFIDPRTTERDFERGTDPASFRFREANLFTPSADGNHLASINEIVELMSFLFSARARGASIHQEIASLENCEISDRPDFFGKPKVEARCFRREYKEGIEDFWRGVPELIEYYRNIDHERQTQFFNYFEEASRAEGRSGKWVDRSDSERLTMVTYLLESAFDRFDINHDDVIDQNETRKMIPIFRKTLKEEFPELPRRYIDTVLPYIFYYKEIPSDWTDRAWFWIENSRAGRWVGWNEYKFEADRTDLMRILANFSEINRQKKQDL
jgi:hypothetical protein